VIEAGRKLYEISGIDSSARRARCCRKYLARVALYSPHGECLLCLKADIGVCPHDVRFTPESDIKPIRLTFSQAVPVASHIHRNPSRLVLNWSTLD
jgi:hypothetical protein